MALHMVWQGMSLPPDFMEPFLHLRIRLDCAPRNSVQYGHL